MSYKEKYLEYKKKYIKIKKLQLIGGTSTIDSKSILNPNISIVESIFDLNNFIIVQVSNNIYHIFTKIDNKICLELKIEHNFIYITNLYKNNIISGTNRMKLVEQLALIIPEIKFIKLSDDSYLIYCGIKINLGLFRILSKYESWYNSLGYIYDTFSQDKEINTNILQMTLNDFLHLCKETINKNIIKENNINELTIKLDKFKKDKEKQIERKMQIMLETIENFENEIKSSKDTIQSQILQNEQNYSNLIADNLFLINKDTITHIFFSEIYDSMKTEKELNCSINILKYNWLQKILLFIDTSNLIKYNHNLYKQIK